MNTAIDAAKGVWRKVTGRPTEGRSKSISEAEAARRAAELRLAETKSQTAYYASLGEASRQIREANHLTDLFFSNRAAHGYRQ